MIQLSFPFVAAMVGVFSQIALAVPSAKHPANCKFPDPPSSKNVVFKEHPYIVHADKPFDGKSLRYGRGVKCGEQTNGNSENAVFILEPGATISNVVIGADQNEGIHCKGPCTILNAWFEDVCEDAITLLQKSGTSNIIGGGARNAVDKVVQHNGGGKVNIESFCGINFGKLYRSCGDCPHQMMREVHIDSVIAQNGKALVGLNANYGDVARIDTSTNSYTNLRSACDTFKGNNGGSKVTRVQVNKHSDK
ncbi:unnamed protein product [Rhizoctonia solani]|uniref:Pectate lyase n=1 Tax=Rhizoctonia solani AG-3 Rhs1AP TaxID=1086054 RepID=X8J5C1_9AGAM|nr:pectate lyase, putative [Rhizoctonia solani AG-3 Rhs1AP]CAE6465774.1 unnamed protein product [Rhizoctonia solani]